MTGVLLGLAAGDRIGGPLRMALRVAESLQEWGGIDVPDIGQRYLTWWRDGAFDTGPTVAQVLTLVANGTSFEHAAIRVDEQAGGKTAGCNPVHRIAPLAMCAAIPDSALGQSAVTEAQLTHRHPIAADVAAAVPCLCRALIRGMPWSNALSLAALGRGVETRRALAILPPHALSRSGFAPDALGAALYFVDTSPSFATALARSLVFAGPANYCPVLVGSIGGARWGRAQIERLSLEHQSDILPRVEAIALSLAQGWENAETY